MINYKFYNKKKKAIWVLNISSTQNHKLSRCICEYTERISTVISYSEPGLTYIVTSLTICRHGGGLVLYVLRQDKHPWIYPMYDLSKLNGMRNQSQGWRNIHTHELVTSIQCSMSNLSFTLHSHSLGKISGYTRHRH